MTREPKGTRAGGRVAKKGAPESGRGLTHGPDEWMAGRYVVAKYGERARESLIDIVEFSGLGEDLVFRGKSAYDCDVQLQLAGEAIQHRVGEAASRLPEELVADHPEIPWYQM